MPTSRSGPPKPSRPTQPHDHQAERHRQAAGQQRQEQRHHECEDHGLLLDEDGLRVLEADGLPERLVAHARPVGQAPVGEPQGQRAKAPSGTMILALQVGQTSAPIMASSFTQASYVSHAVSQATARKTTVATAKLLRP